jgi:hypothetical protein
MCTNSNHKRCRFAQFAIGMRMPRCLFRFTQEKHKMCISCQRRIRTVKRDGRTMNVGLGYEIADLTEDVLLNEEKLPSSQVQEMIELFTTAGPLSESSGTDLVNG